MDGHLGNLTEKQQIALDTFKRSCSEYLTKSYHDDHFCLRWLRARDFDTDAAKLMLEKSLDYRRRWRLDHITTEYKINGCLKKIFCGGICGFNKSGGCVHIYPLACMQPRNALRVARRSEIIRVVLQRMEMSMQSAREESKRLGKNIETMTLIFDVAGFDIMKNLSTSDISVFLELLSTYELNYPETLQQAFVINAPPIFSLFFNVLKPVLNGHTLSKVKILGRDTAKWQAELLEAIDAEELPVRYGGKKQGKDGDDDCRDQIVYIDKLNDEMIDAMKKDYNEEELCINLTVCRRSTYDYPVDVTEENSGLQIEFESVGHDMGFSLIRKGIDGDKEVLPNKRYKSHEGSVLIRMQCSKGTYILRFDNTYSAMRSKNVMLTVNRIPAAEFNESMALIHEP